MTQELESRETAAQGPVQLHHAAGPWARPNWPTVVVALLSAGLLPWGFLHLGNGNYLTHLFITVFIWGIVTQAWNLILGVSGIFSMAQLALLAVGGYASALVTLHLGWSPWVSMWVAPFAAAAAALIIGLPILRLRGVYVVLLTLGFNELLRNFLTTGPSFFGGGFGLRTPRLGFEHWFGGRYELLLYYYAALILFGLASYAIYRLTYSPIGMAFLALRDSEGYAVSRGIDPFRFKVFLFGFSAFFTGLAGAFLTYYQGNISPGVLSFPFIVNLTTMIVLGGWGRFSGPIVGTVLLTFLSEYLRTFSSGFRPLVLGGILAAIVVLAPQGLAPMITGVIRNVIRTFREAE